MTDHYYSEQQQSELRIKQIQVTLFDKSFAIFSAPGIFSKSELDKGTRLLIENAQIPEKATILDLGCGYGIVGLSLLREDKNTKCIFVDINQRALLLTKRNLHYHKIQSEQFEIIHSNLYESLKEKQFDVILSNPPQSAGKDICLQIIEQALRHLNSNGSLQLVARPNKGGKTLAKKMKEVFGNVEIIGRGYGFCVYRSVR
ncbi:class I SAM-dependent methyltransferase [Candidatus Woesearchaeota archaeon]|nr:class I SAM-dependent methyltransferase [Candidatus Woesearchaeota archaeon]